MTATGNRQDFPLPLHGEFYYFRHPPRMIWFYCACPAEQGGETTIGDGAALMRALPPETADLFRRRRITYARLLDEFVRRFGAPPRRPGTAPGDERRGESCNACSTVGLLNKTGGHK